MPSTVFWIRVFFMEGNCHLLLDMLSGHSALRLWFLQPAITCHPHGNYKHGKRAEAVNNERNKQKQTSDLTIIHLPAIHKQKNTYQRQQQSDFVYVRAVNAPDKSYLQKPPHIIVLRTLIKYSVHCLPDAGFALKHITTCSKIGWIIS